MRNTDERLVAVQRRVEELERQKRQRKYRYIGWSAVAACLIIIVGTAVAMPGIMAGLSEKDYNNTGMMASIFSEGRVLGYILIGLLAFALGVCLTILCFLLQPRRQWDKGDCNNDRTH
ncbi:DUF4179 domain-containing protein [Acetivibrio mesophilus]|uniref:DUF4179 domain-containing protein n=1 Tax=Acetivibrio mesophilus TaxID=2487273 RepID=A0A4Q0I883_9FIRM|nr:DUF4179 domain-containing protein [Acetivibrio mesophilus]ODM26283.1 ABC transporter [Clostridium sp. Bc-iso-3]RXE60661.1 DUF4179 domain-containing protein [Acetivibrio mesophilus]HHV28073.1 DUF4179 domain-containing protein [Clostridium sp.]